MTEPDFPIIRVSECDMRKMFNEGRYWEKIQRGELKMSVRRSTHPTRTKANEPFCTYTQEISYLDQDGREVARVHQYLRPDGSIGAKGRPDPKRLFINSIMYRLRTKPRAEESDAGSRSPS